MTEGASDPLAADLRVAIGADSVLVDPDLTARYETDWMGRSFGHARMVVRPSTTEEVQIVVDTCRAAGAPVVVQGGNTGLVAGGVPRGGEVVLSTSRIDWVDRPDPVSGTLAAGAGATLSSVRAAVAPAGFDVAVDLAARDSATVGGMTATNAGGLRVIRYGHMRTQLLGLEAVLADGQVVRRMAGLAKDTAGYDLTGLLCGSEGTLAVITAVLMRLVPAARSRATAVVGLSSLEEALSVVADLRRRVPELEAAEVVFADGVARAIELLGVRSPVDPSWPCQLLVEAASVNDDDESLVERLGAVLDSAGTSSATAVAVDEATRTSLWAMRERHPELVVGLGTPHKLDVSLPLPALVQFECEVRRVLAEAAPEAGTVIYGHLGDGGLHVNVARPLPAEGAADRSDAAEAAEWRRRIDEAVLGLVGSLGGSVSAEHGIGTEKVPFVGLTRGPAELSAMRRIKDALDPDGLFNPGVLFA